MFKKAERKQAKLRLGLAGPTGSGKTWSALLMARGMANLLVSRIAFIDTERRAHLYGGDFDFDVIEMQPPYTVEKYISYISDAEKAGYKILIIDSLSHAWNGEGGVLDVVKNSGGQYQKGWDKGTPAQNKLIGAIMSSPMHIITCARAKMEYVMEETTNKSGNKTMSPKKIGLAPVQRNDLEYEFTVWMNMNAEHVAHFEKDNTRIYEDQYLTPTEEMGKVFVEWLNSGVDVPLPPKPENIESLIADATIALNDCQTMTELKDTFQNLSEPVKKKVVHIKDEVKARLTAPPPKVLTDAFPDATENFLRHEINKLDKELKEVAA